MRWHVQLEFDQVTILGWEEVLHRIGVYFSQGSVELSFPSYEVRPLIASHFADFASLVDESSEHDTCNKCIRLHWI